MTNDQFPNDQAPMTNAVRFVHWSLAIRSRRARTPLRRGACKPPGTTLECKVGGGPLPAARGNPKLEARNPKRAGPFRYSDLFRISVFGFVSDFGFCAFGFP